MVIVSGDSWPVGVWRDKDLPDNMGLAYHLNQQGHDVISLAKPGGSNLESVDRLRDFLQSNQHLVKSIDCVLFWQTEFFREVWYYRQHSTIHPTLDQELSVGYAQLRDNWVYRPYYRLSEIAQQWQIPVYVIGGCSDTVWYDDFEINFPGVQILCQSTTNLLLHNNHRIEQPVFCQFLTRWIEEGDFLNLVRRNIVDEDYQQLLADMDLGKQRILDLRQNPDLFYPDGIHPNAQAHKQIFDFVRTNVPELANETA